MKIIKFEKGSPLIYYKKSLNQDDFTSLSFLKKSAVNNVTHGILPGAKINARGIKATKNANIIKDIGNIMPSSRLLFWRQLPEADVPDLITNFE